MRAPLFAVLIVVLVGCGAAQPAQAVVPAKELVFPRSSPLPPDAEPDDSDPTDARLRELLGEPPWTGRLVEVTHSYSNGCTDRRTEEIVAFESAHVKMPIIIGWTKPMPTSHEDPIFLHRRQHAALGFTECATLYGSVVTYAYEGIVGAPARAILADRVERAACP